MKFTKQNADERPLADNVFSVLKLAKAAAAEYGDAAIVNATIGSLCDEEGKIVAYNSVYSCYDQIDNGTKAQYAQGIAGNADYRQAVYEWATYGIDLKLAHEVIATPGGSGAIALTMMDILDPGMEVLLPDLAWGSYALMAKMNNLKVKRYAMFDEDHFDTEYFLERCRETIAKQGKLLVVINDPCHNPSGYSLTIDEWRRIIAGINALAAQGPCVIVNDIAYIDYSNELAHSRDYMRTFADIDPRVAVIVAFSCSKTLTSYGMRLGAAIIMGKDGEAVKGLANVFENSARSTWSNVNNGWMENFVDVVNGNRQAFLDEKAGYIQLMRQRSAAFLDEAAACGLAVYPYKEGFFITVKADEQLLDRYHEALLAANIFTVKLPLGIRIAVCSVPLNKITGLAKRMKDIYDQVAEAS